MSAESTVTAPTTRRSAVTFPTVAAAGGVCTSCTPAVVYRYCTLSCSVRLVLLVSATDEQQLLERETPNPTLSAPIKRTQRVSHLSGAVSRDTSERHDLLYRSQRRASLCLKQHRIRVVELVLIPHGRHPPQRVTIANTIRLWYSERDGLDWGPRNPVHRIEGPP